MPYYNTSAPTPTTKNSINSMLAVGNIRDFLLRRNIQNPIKYPQLSTSVNGSPKGGEPFLDTMVGNGSIIQQISIEIDGLVRYGNAIIMNRYKDVDPSAPSLFDIENVPAVPIFPTPPNGTSNYQQVDIKKYGLLPKSNFGEYRKYNTIKNLYIDAPKQIDMADFIRFQPAVPIFPTPPNGTSNYQQVDNTKYGLLPKSNFGEYRKYNTIKNIYLDVPKQVDMADFITVQPILTTSQRTNYLDEYGNTTLTDTVDIIGSVLNGQGVGIGAGGGLVSNFDLRSSLAGRVLTATGLFKDTKLGVIGGQQLALALANNAAFNVQQAAIGSLNIKENIYNLIKGSGLKSRADYNITVSSSKGGSILNAAERILGFNVPKSQLDPSGSIFQSENGGVGNIKRANSMLKNTGKGQKTALITNILENNKNIKGPFRSGYVPGFDDIGVKPNGYAFMDGNGNIKDSILGKITDAEPIPEINYNRTNMVNTEGFTDFDDVYGNGVININNRKFSWQSESGGTLNKPVNVDSFFQKNDKKTLLGKTQKLFNSVGMKNIVSVKSDMTIKDGSQIQSSVVLGGISKGSAVLKGSQFDNKTGTIINRTNVDKTDSDQANVFCRSWSNYDRYDSVNKLIRHRGLNKSEQNKEQDIIEVGNNKSKGWRLNLDGSVLDDNGFVKIAPYKGDNLTRNFTSPKKYMFSIENLAWVGTPAASLLPCEQGPGDLLTGKFGKIMWFPPYDLTFSETSSLNIETTQFIGRGEPIYTYNNTERTGNLSFSVIVDHPSIVNSFAGSNGPDDEFIRSWFAGCVDLDSQWSRKLTQDQLDNLPTTKPIIPIIQTITPILVPTDFNIYFKNDRIDVDDKYEANPYGTEGIGKYETIQLDYKKIYSKSKKEYECIPKKKYTREWTDRKSYALNKSHALNKSAQVKFGNFIGTWIESDFKDKLLEYFNTLDLKYHTVIITAKGFASTQGCPQQNILLSQGRADNTISWLKEILKDCVNINKINFTTLIGGETGPKFDENVKQDEEEPKKNRYVTVSFKAVSTQTQVDVEQPKTVEVEQQISLSQQIKNRFYTECDFFEKLGENDPFIYDSIKQKIRYFHPAFHSTTPEGFNSRLTFLLQCTRQGATISDAGPKNLAFGAPPVCILRIGDFYNTKIIMDNVNFDYEPLVWDLNPEGIGVQPMIAKVSISFRYIGGSSLYGPINKLQNALSFNFFANTQTYDPRADTLAIKKDNKGGDQKRKQNEFEYDYTLVAGLDPSKDSMKPLSTNEIKETTAVDTSNKSTQVNDSEKSTKNEAPESTQVSTDKNPLFLSGSFTVDGTKTSICDELHAFQGTSKCIEPKAYNADGTCKTESITIGNFNLIVNERLEELYSDGYNPIITDMQVSIEKLKDGRLKNNWTVRIEDNKGKKAFIRITSRGSADDKATAQANYATLAEKIRIEVNTKYPASLNSFTIAPIIPKNLKAEDDGYIYVKAPDKQCQFWQKFVMYDLPNDFPPH